MKRISSVCCVPLFFDFFFVLLRRQSITFYLLIVTLELFLTCLSVSFGNKLAAVAHGDWKLAHTLSPSLYLSSCLCIYIINKLLYIYIVNTD